MWLDQRLRHAVLLRAEDHLLNAAGTDGLMAQASALAPAFTPGTGATGLDAINGALSQLASLGYSPDGIVLSATDSFALKGLKTSTTEYLWSSPSDPFGMNSMWGVRVVVSPSMTANNWLVGSFQQATALIQRQQLVIEAATQNEDDFVRNLITLRCEERIGLMVGAPTGLVKGVFSTGATAAAPETKNAAPPARK
jgi:HK97 family phage major capsid protein